MIHPKVEIFISEQPEEKQEILWTLRNEILNLSSNIEERFSYGIPFYNYGKPLCYLNPTKGGLHIGFYYGNELTERKGFFEHYGRNQVKIIKVVSLKKFNFKLFQEVLAEALMINETKLKK